MLFSAFFLCPNCALPFDRTTISLGESYYLNSDCDISCSSSSSSNSSEDTPPLCAFLNQKHHKNFKIAHLNINSFKNKFYDCVEILHSGVFDIMAFSETKLGPSFFTTQFLVPGYKPPLRIDNSTQSGGLILYYKDNVQCVQRAQFNLPSFECIVCDFKINDRTWCLFHIYRRPSRLKASLDLFYKEFLNSVDRAFIKYDNIIIMGDLNIDMFDSDFSKEFTSFTQVLDLKNLVKDATCFKNKDKPSLIDIMLTNKPQYVKTTGTLDTGLSDFHRLTYMVLKVHRPKPTKNIRSFRSFKKGDHSQFVESLSHCPFNIMHMFDDPDDQYYVFNTLFSQVVDEFYPVKNKTFNHKPPPYMNKNYRQNIYKKSQLDNKRRLYPSNSNYENFRVQRNKCVKLRNSAVRDHVSRKCSEGAKGGREFWQVVGPFVNSKSSKNNSSHIDLIKDDKVISDQTKVCNILNTHFINKPANIGNSSAYQLCGPLQQGSLSNHPSVLTINQKANKVNFSFQHVQQGTVRTSIKALKNKAPGHNKISAKILKIAAPVISPPIATLFNCCVDSSIFPSAGKMAEVTPGLKRGADTEECNYRPLSVLPAIAKVLEDLMLVQMEPVNNTILHKLISAYRPGHSCQDVLLYIINSFNQALDNGKCVGAVATDLSSAFDCLPPNLMYHKLVAYGFSHNSALLIHNYLSGRSQRVKIGSTVGDWMNLTKGTPQGSKLGPNLFNLFINDLLYSLPDDSVVNFADDNTLYAVHGSPRGLRDKLNSLVNNAQQWYIDNGMQSNPTKFQSKFFGNTPKCEITIDNIIIESTGLIKLLDVNIDAHLKFSAHITNICIKAGSNLNAVKRFARCLPTKVRLQLYTTYISCHFNFCPLVWHFCSQSDTD